MSDSLRFFERIDAIPAAAWNRLAGPHAGLQHAFLHALEASGSVGGNTGWTPHHATLWEGDTLVAAMPLYRKWHSWGEYVFDWAWAQAYEQHGLAYYPKWLCAIPFSPLPGRRLLGADIAHRAQLLRETLGWIAAGEASSFHLLFPDADDTALAAAAGLQIRHGVQFHWHNAGYQDFAHFLSHLTRDKRKKIRQERQRVAAAGVIFDWLAGGDIGDAALDFFYHCYCLTYALRRSTPYLTRDFFARLIATAPDNVRLLIARRDGKPVASAWFLADAQALYGRYWGAVEDISCLHFEACYYQGIDYAIRHGLARFEGGAQGEHKLSRGLVSTPVSSAHWIRDARFSAAIADYLRRERAGIAGYLDELDERSPFRSQPPA
ncbi:GNAT family N-acetyltransferase [Denitromonas iodatirespirans]|uniref:N-acetyltransferase n=1 Tax=Denitromonas iodatirespirans TaxID=2795389 RepID=A0A944D9L5_DENI1|nr:GNAT family N-acetyltransferase [Denitromonas iodatirespirans]MBT0961242.1 N-acetyltransferase [Denitromonas iodatirespirans]